jgi:hypothetical protein
MKVKKTLGNQWTNETQAKFKEIISKIPW